MKSAIQHFKLVCVTIITKDLAKSSETEWVNMNIKYGKIELFEIFLSALGML